MFVNNIDPVLISTGPFTIRYYGLLLAIGIILTLIISARLFKQNKYSIEKMLDLSIWLIVCGLIGARLGHVFFYNAIYYLKHPIEILYIHHGGLSSHGLGFGILIGLWLCWKIQKIEWKKYIDILIIPMPFLGIFIRTANFINSEIVGRPTDVPWAVLFPRFEANPIPRHPSQLYEAGIALILFIILYTIYMKYNKKLPKHFIFNSFLFLYFTSRFFIEFLKEYNIFSHGLTMGQWLSIPFIIWSTAYFIKYLLKIKVKACTNKS